MDDNKRIIEAMRKSPESGFHLLMAKYGEPVYWHTPYTCEARGCRGCCPRDFRANLPLIQAVSYRQFIQGMDLPHCDERGIANIRQKAKDGDYTDRGCAVRDNPNGTAGLY